MPSRIKFKITFGENYLIGQSWWSKGCTPKYIIKFGIDAKLKSIKGIIQGMNYISNYLMLIKCYCRNIYLRTFDIGHVFLKAS